MANACQMPNESEMDFCLKIMSLRERVVNLSAEEGVPFDSNLLRKRFFLTLSTGFKNNSFRLELQSLLKMGTISDEDLLKEVSLIMGSEQERSSKKSKASVHQISADSSNNSCQSKKKDVAKKENPLLVEIHKLSAQISELSTVREDLNNLKKEVNAQLYTNKKNQPHDQPKYYNQHFQNKRLYRCRNCELSNNFRCYHCFSCGGTDHRRTQCPNLKKN